MKGYLLHPGYAVKILDIKLLIVCDHSYELALGLVVLDDIGLAELVGLGFADTVDVGLAELVGFGIADIVDFGLTELEGVGLAVLKKIGLLELAATGLLVGIGLGDIVGVFEGYTLGEPTIDS